MASLRKTVISWVIPGLFVSLAAACGGTNDEPRQAAVEESPDSVDPFDCSASREWEFSVLQDFEKGTATHFYTNADGTEGSVVEPTPGSSSPPASDIEGGRCGTSERAFRMTGEGLRTWGMVFGWNFQAGSRDFSDWDGISFWARRGSEDSGRSLFFSVFDPGTDTSGGLCDAESDILEEKCDSYGTGIGLDTEWRFFAIPFSSLRQRGFGVATERLITEEVIGINWAADQGDWDVWMDDVALYRAGGSVVQSGSIGQGGSDVSGQ